MTRILPLVVCFCCFLFYLHYKRTTNLLHSKLQVAEDQRAEWKRRAQISQKRLLTAEVIARAFERSIKDSRSAQRNHRLELLRAINDGVPFPSVLAAQQVEVDNALAPYLYTLTFTINRTNVITALHCGCKWASTQSTPHHFYQFHNGFLYGAASVIGDAP